MSGDVVYHVIVEVEGKRMTRCSYSTPREREALGADAGLIPMSRSRTRCPRCNSYLTEPES